MNLIFYCQGGNMLNSQSKNKQAVFRQTISGLTAGLTVSFIAFPLEASKKWLQTASQYRKPYHPYRGYGIFVLNIGPSTTLQFGVSALIQQTIPSDSSFAAKQTGYFVGGVVGAFTATAVENCIVRQQILQTTMPHAFKEMFTTGVLRPWKSFTFIAMRDGIFTMWMLGVLPKLKEQLTTSHGNVVATIAHVGASLFGALLSQPFDTLATTMQQTNDRVAYQEVIKRALLSQEVIKRENKMRTALLYNLPASVEDSFRANELEKINQTIRQQKIAEKTYQQFSFKDALKRATTTDIIQGLWRGAPARLLLFPLYMGALPAVAKEADTFLSEHISGLSSHH